MANLIDNSLRYTPECGTVAISGEWQNGCVRITVSDTGRGIPPDEIDRITERFYKGRSAPGRTAGGTGLGLSIVARILELHESELAVESAVGAGTRVSFALKSA